MPALTDLQSTPAGVPPPPQGVTDQDPQFYDWLATQSPATRKFYTEDRLNQDKASSSSNRHKHVRAAQDMLQKAIQGVLSSGGSVPGVNPQTGEGISFSTPAAKADFMASAAIRTNQAPKAQADALTPEQLAVNPTQLTIDDQAAHPEKYLAQEQAIAQTRQDTTGLDAQKASLADETAAINQGGLTAIDRARLLDSQMKRGMEARAQESAIMQGAEQQGRAGSQAQLVARQNAQQGSSNQQAQENAQTMALGLARKDSLMGQRATQGSTMQNAQDALDAFNTKNARDVQAANVSNVNAATDTGNKTRVAQGAANTDIANKAEYYNKGPGGLPGVIGLQEGANAPVTGTQEHLGDQQADLGKAQDAAIAQKTAQDYQLGENIAGTAVGAITSAIPKPKP